LFGIRHACSFACFFDDRFLFRPGELEISMNAVETAYGAGSATKVRKTGPVPGAPAREKERRIGGRAGSGDSGLKSALAEHAPAPGRRTGAGQELEAGGLFAAMPADRFLNLHS